MNQVLDDNDRHARNRTHRKARQNRRERREIQLVKRDDRNLDVIQDDRHRRKDAAAGHDEQGVVFLSRICHGKKLLLRFRAFDFRKTSP